MHKRETPLYNIVSYPCVSYGTYFILRGAIVVCDLPRGRKLLNTYNFYDTTSRLQVII